MNEQEFSSDYWQHVWENITLPQEVHPGDIWEIHRIFTKILPHGKYSFIEIGCAPGKWMAYFSRQFGFSVSGVEYVSGACAKTRENMERLSIAAKIYDTDLFEFEPTSMYDIVFSAGFIEHFRDAKAVVARLAGLGNPRGGFVITLIPSMEGLNRWISRTFRPRVAAGHFPIDLQQLIALHEKLGLHTLYADYVGGLEIRPPMKKNRFAADHTTMSFLVNLPFHLWNRAAKKMAKTTGIYPKIGWVTNSLLYIGRRNPRAG